MRKLILLPYLLLVSLMAASQPWFLAQVGTPIKLQNFLQPEAGCNWSGIAGQAFDRQGNPVIGSVVHVWGILDGEEVIRYVMTGSSNRVGPGGFEITLADHQISTPGKLSLQLLDLAGVKLSPEISLDIANDCEHNLVLVNLIEIPTDYHFYLPAIRK